MIGSFTITDHKGIRIQFENGWTVSIQFGPGNYSDNYSGHDWEGPRKADLWHSTTAETALIDPAGKFIEYGDGDVQGYCTPQQVAALIAFAAAK